MSEQVTKQKQKRMIKYPSIEAFRHTVSSLKRGKFSHLIEHEDGTKEPVFEKIGNVTFKGFVKIHGTNAGVTMDLETGEIYAQSRKNVITPEKDNAGFAFFAHSNLDVFKEMFDKLIIENRSSVTNDLYSKGYLSIFGEWAGQGIQKSVAVNELPKAFYIFGVKLSPNDPDDTKTAQAIWLDSNTLRKDDVGVHNIVDYESFELTFDPQDEESLRTAAARIDELTLYVEQECPVGRKHGISGVGEGIVWTFEGSEGVGRHVFKSKGEKHAVAGNSKKGQATTIDPVKLANVNEFVDYAATVNRFQQGVKETGIESVKDLSKLVKWVQGDIIKEESDTLASNGLEPKDVNGPIAKKVVNWYKNDLTNE